MAAESMDSTKSQAPHVDSLTATCHEPQAGMVAVSGTGGWKVPI